MEHQMMIKGHLLHVDERGPSDGPAVVLLHHGLGTTRSWRGQIPALAAAGFHVIAYDRWGYGKSGPRPQFSMPYFTEDLEDLYLLLDAFHLDRAALVGHSDGGTIALYFSATHPHRVTCLVTVAAHIYVEARMHSGLLDIRRTYQGDAEFRRKFDRQHGEKAAAVFEGWFNGWNRPDVLSWDMRPVIRNIACPALVVQGEADEHATPKHARQVVASIPGSELWLVPGAGHMLPRDRRQEFNHKLINFLTVNGILSQGALHVQQGFDR